MENNKIDELLEKYRLGQCTAGEKAALESWYIAQASGDEEPLPELDFQYQHDDLWNRISKAVAAAPAKVSLWPRLVAAAVILVVLGAGLFYYNNQRTARVAEGGLARDVKPGGMGATLTLASGQQIRLGDAARGELAREAGVTISKSADGRLVYVLKEGGLSGQDPAATNTLSTAKGETYQVLLPDGSAVWLNAASSLTYPASFAKLDKRRVELRGEGYFQVAKDKAHPFVVVTGRQEVTVLGTHFNINAYADEPAVKTTLIEGSVKVSAVADSQLVKILKPGQQAAFGSHAIQVAAIDPELAVAWKNNQFIFESDDIRYIMRMISRWYNLEVEYVGPVPEDKFGGAISRFENVSKVLIPLEATGNVKFKLSGRRIMVSK